MQKLPKVLIILVNRQFTEKEPQMALQHIRSYSPTFIMRKMEIKTTLRYYFPAIRLAKVKNQTCMGKAMKGRLSHVCLLGM